MLKLNIPLHHKSAVVIAALTQKTVGTEQFIFEAITNSDEKKNLHGKLQPLTPNSPNFSNK